MKNTIKYFYNIDANNIRQSGDVFFIESNSDIFALQNCNNYVDTIDEIYQLNIYLNYNNVYIYSIIKNRFNNLITIINENNYILLKVDSYYDKNVTLEMIYDFQYKYKADNNFAMNNFKNLNASGWKSLWMKKVDYFEYQISEFGLNFPLIRESISYYIGMAENAITALNGISNEDLYLQHRRIDINSKCYEFYNPLNLVFDTRIRDFCEYYKSDFIYNQGYKKNIHLIEYLKQNNYTANELNLFYIRLFFPSFYFDLYESMVNKGKDEMRVKKILIMVNDYQLLLKEVGDYLGNFVHLPHIDWINY